jgi:hypothetical protein
MSHNTGGRLHHSESGPFVYEDLPLPDASTSIRSNSKAPATLGGSTAPSTSSICIGGCTFRDVVPIQGPTVYIQVYTGFTPGTKGPSDGEHGSDWMDGLLFQKAWTDVKEQLESLQKVWYDCPTLFDRLTGYLDPLVRLPCEGEHLQVKELCDSFHDFDTVVKTALQFREEFTAYSNPEFRNRWPAIQASMNKLDREIQAICDYSCLDRLPKGAVLRVVSEEQYPDGRFRRCANSQASNSLIHFVEGRVSG